MIDSLIQLKLTRHQKRQKVKNSNFKILIDLNVKLSKYENFQMIC